MPTNRRKPPRYLAEVIAMKRAGKTYDDIGRALGVSRQRIQQIYSHSRDYKQSPPRQNTGEQRQRLAKDELIAAMDALDTAVVPEPEVIAKIDKENVEPIVYTFVNGEEVLYVGQSITGIRRPLSAMTDPAGVSAGEKNRHAAYAAATHIHIFKCAGVEHMDALEVKLILKHRPRFNKQLGRYKHINGHRISA